MFKSLLLFLLFSPLLGHSTPLKVEVSAPSAILINQKTGAVLYEKNAHIPSYPASVTKIATALYALEKKSYSLNEMIAAPLDAIGTVTPQERRSERGKHPPYRLEFGGTHMGIKQGEVLSLRDLIYGLMVVSGNDAANVIAHHVSGSIPKFMEDLNAYLKQIGCNETTFNSPHGLPHTAHKTTAYDLAKMTAKAMEYPFFREVVKTVCYIRPETNKQEEVYLGQTNHLLKKGKYYYPKAIGVKTGYTLSGGHVLVAAAEDKGRLVIAVILNCQEVGDRYKDAIALFDTAFNEKQVIRKLLDKEHDHFSLSVKGAKELIKASLHDDLSLTYFPSEEKEYKAVLQWHTFKLPVQKDALVGEIRVVSKDGLLLKSQPIFAMKEVKATLLFQLSQFLKNKKNTGILALMALTTGAAFFLCFRKGKKDELVH